MVSLENAVIARLHKGADHFEVLVDPHEAEHILEGKIENILSALAIDAVFSDAKKGTHAPIETLQKHFKTTDISIIAKEIIQKGEIQLTTEQRREMQEKKKKRIVELIMKNAMDPKTKTSHPRTRIELAMDEAKVHIDPFKSVNQQMKTILEQLRPILPISMEQARVSVKIPPEHVGKAYGAVRSFGTLEREEWQSDGTWIGVVKLPAGMQTDFYDRLNTLTKGNVETRILK
ncbi:MAG TPA: ribosome assembly factor SBDS [Candidatus Thermoplasmatota archaeon]|nr:ribosome assembly factor SBDS [Candidatus Thermoplasmatota archaeon]